MIEYIKVKGGNRLSGRVSIEGAKNAVLPIMATALLASEGEVVLNNVPDIEDVDIMADILRGLNAKVTLLKKEKQMIIDATDELKNIAPFELVSKMRASIVVMGSLLSRTGYAKVSLPGGDAIGSRPVDLHLKGFQALGAKTGQSQGGIEADASERGLHGARIYLDFPSVGATQNIILAAVQSSGTTILENAAGETEIVNMVNLLNKMGAKISGAGTTVLRIEGVEKLHGAVHSIVQDRIEAGTFMIAAALTGGDVLIEEAIREHNRPLLSKLQEAGAKIEVSEEGIRVIGPKFLKPTSIKTLPHPGFPTDLQAQFTILQTQAVGMSTTKETIFENRFQHLEEMKKMDVYYFVERDTAILKGDNRLIGGVVYGSDIRAAAALVLAGLVAEGTTEVHNLEHLDRGYFEFHKKLANLGANIERVKVLEEVEA
jgi:UDP-N-acetylglucosamine 1-carboxyvinyltransferase